MPWWVATRSSQITLGRTCCYNMYNIPIDSFKFSKIHIPVITPPLQTCTILQAERKAHNESCIFSYHLYKPSNTESHFELLHLNYTCIMSSLEVAPTTLATFSSSHRALHDFHLRTWSRQCRDELAVPACQISTSEVIKFTKLLRRYTDTQTQPDWLLSLVH